MYLPSVTWSEASRYLSQDPIVLQPLGSTEQHGSIGPLGTDFMIAERLARDLEASTDIPVILLPVLPYGSCSAHRAFAGTVDIGTQTLTAILRSVVESMTAAGARRFVFLNGHGGNDPAIDNACFKAWEEGGIGAKVNWWTVARDLNPAWGGGHGGAQEASVMAALHPDLVDPDKAPDERIFHLSKELFADYGNTVTFKGAKIGIFRPTEEFTATGTFGGVNDESRKTDAGRGKEIYRGVLNWLKAFIIEFSHVELQNRRGKPKPLGS